MSSTRPSTPAGEALAGRPGPRKLNLFLSMLAAIQAPVILMSQNRHSERDRLNAEHDYEVNLKAELDIMLLHERMDLLREKQWAELLAMQKEQLEILSTLIHQKATSP